MKVKFLDFKFLEFQKACFKLCGYSFMADESIFLRIVAVAHYVLLIIISVPEMLFVLVNTSNLALATDSLCPVLSTYIMITKMCTIAASKDKFYKFVDKIKVLYDNGMLDPLDAELLNKEFKYENRIAVLNGVSTVMVGILYILCSIIKSVMELYYDGYSSWSMPVRTVFPYDTSISPYYELTYVWFSFCILGCVMITLAVDTLFYAAAFNFGGHFKIIDRRIQLLNNYDNLTELDYKKIVNKFHEIIRYHSNIIGLCNELRDLYSPIMFSQFLLSSVQLCVLVFQLTLPSQSRVYLVLFGMFIVMIFFQIFIYCHGGTELTTESHSISQAFYNCEWYNYPPNIRRIILFCMMRAQDGIIIKSGIFEATMVRFTTTLSTAGSCITLLQSVA